MKRVVFVAILLVASFGVSASSRPNPLMNRRRPPTSLRQTAAPQTDAPQNVALRCGIDDKVRQEVVDGVPWYFKDEVLHDEISHCYHTNAIVTRAGADKYTGDLVVPSSLGGHGVTDIDLCAFQSCKALTSVVLPEGITRIYNCAFEHCSSLKRVTIPSTVVFIGDGAFHGCSTLTNVTLPNALKELGYRAFENCKALTRVTIPAKTTEVGARSFANCCALTNVVMPEGVQEIGNSAFSGCSALVRLDVPSTVTSLGKDLLSGCSSLEALSVAAGNKHYKVINNCIVSASGKTLIAAPRRCVDVSVPEGVKTIPGALFDNNKYLKNVVLPDSVVCIDQEAFNGCSSLTNVTIPSNVAFIGENAFRGCSAIRDVKFLGNVPTGIEKSGLSDAEGQGTPRGLRQLIGSLRKPSHRLRAADAQHATFCQAMSNHLAAAETGNAEDQFWMARYCLACSKKLSDARSDKKYEYAVEAMRWLTKAADGGQTNAMEAIGTMLIDGEGDELGIGSQMAGSRGQRLLEKMVSLVEEYPLSFTPGEMRQCKFKPDFLYNRHAIEVRTKGTGPVLRRYKVTYRRLYKKDIERGVSYLKKAAEKGFPEARNWFESRARYNIPEGLPTEACATNSFSLPANGPMFKYTVMTRVGYGTQVSEFYRTITIDATGRVVGVSAEFTEQEARSPWHVPADYVVIEE